MERVEIKFVVEELIENNNWVFDNNWVFEGSHLSLELAQKWINTWQKEFPNAKFRIVKRIRTTEEEILE